MFVCTTYKLSDFVVHRCNPDFTDIDLYSSTLANTSSCIQVRSNPEFTCPILLVLKMVWKQIHRSRYHSWTSDSTTWFDHLFHSHECWNPLKVTHLTNFLPIMSERFEPFFACCRLQWQTRQVGDKEQASVELTSPVPINPKFLSSIYYRVRLKVLSIETSRFLQSLSVSLVRHSFTIWNSHGNKQRTRRSKRDCVFFLHSIQCSCAPKICFKDMSIGR